MSFIKFSTNRFVGNLCPLEATNLFSNSIGYIFFRKEKKKTLLMKRSAVINSNTIWAFCFSHQTLTPIFLSKRRIDIYRRYFIVKKIKKTLSIKDNLISVSLYIY
jgi:hypothetical protein